MNNIEQFNHILNSFKIKASCLDIHQVDNYIFYDVKLHPQAKVKDFQKYGDEISLALKKPNKPSVKILHEEGIVRIEFALPREEPLKLFDFFTNDNVPDGGLVCLLGQAVNGDKVWMDLSQNPHMIVAGTTGSGKSTLLHNIMGNMLNYNDAYVFLVDPKNIEFHLYEDLHNEQINVTYSYDGAMNFLDSLLALMEQRYAMIRAGESIEEFPYVLFMVDEFADLIMQDKDDLFFSKLCRLAQKCRAARISIVLATQRPSVNIINGAIKANFPARLSCKVASHVDSKVILDTVGAENLLGAGDALLRDNFRHMERFQVAYTNAVEVCDLLG